MTNAVISLLSSAQGSQDNFLNSLTVAMQAAGFTLLDSYGSSPNAARVYSFNTGTGKAYSTLIIEARFAEPTSFQIRGHSAFNTETHVGLGTAQVAKAINPELAYAFHVCNHPEVRGVNVIKTNGIPLAFVGYLRPLVPTINEDFYPFGFIDRSQADNWQSSTLQPISSLHPFPTADLGLLPYGTVNSDPLRGKRILLPAGIGYNFNSAAEFSADCMLGASSNMNLLDVFQVTPGVEEYKLFDGSFFPQFARVAMRVI
jgi:hypothetical protein